MATTSNVQDTLERLPGWGSMTAYTRAKYAFAELVRRGQRVPSWMGIRDVIGKGSATDIQRAIEDARQEQGETLRKMEGFSGGVPESLTPHVQGFWLAAIDAATVRFAEQEVVWEAKLNAVMAELSVSLLDVETLRSEMDKKDLSLRELQEGNATLTTQLEQERAGRLQAERMAEIGRTDLMKQREQLQTELTKTQAGYESAILRLEGIEQHALLEVERVKSHYESQLTRLNDKIQRDAMELKMAETRYDKSQRELRATLNECQQEHALATQALTHLKNTADQAEKDKQRAEQRVDFLSAENSKLLTSLNEAVNRHNELLKKSINREKMS